MGFTLLNHQFEDASFSNEETNKQVLDQCVYIKNMSISKIDIPFGWQALVLDYLSMLSKIRGIKRVCHLYASHGALESIIEIEYRGKSKVPFELMHRYRQKSFDACYGCGKMNARNKFMLQTVINICRQCQQELDNSGYTGTWLDSI